MVPQEPLDLKRGQQRKRYTLLFQPTAEVFNDVDVTANSCARVTPRTQMLDEETENYAKVVGRNPAMHKGALEKLPRAGETQSTLMFHRFRQHSGYPSSQPNTTLNFAQRKSRGLHLRINTTLAYLLPSPFVPVV